MDFKPKKRSLNLFTFHQCLEEPDFSGSQAATAQALRQGPWNLIKFFAGKSQYFKQRYSTSLKQE